MTDEQVLQNLREIQKAMEGTTAELLAATKTVSVDQINLVIRNGVKHIGENRVQELLEKYPFIENRDNITVHMIGHLQTNKVKSIIDKVDLIHSVDSERLLAEIQKQAEKINKIQDILIEVNIGREESKGGIMPEEAQSLVDICDNLPNIRWRGLMCIPPAGEPSAEYFEKMHKMLVDITAQKLDNINKYILSMGMSSDYMSAIEHGSTMVRIGSVLFGRRQY